MTPPPRLPRVVLVDDDATIRRFVGLALEDLAMEFVPCADAASARAALRQGPAALLITDLMMPGESGFDLLASLVADPALRGGARLAVFSAGLNARTRARLAGLDVWRELDKPVSVTALEACVAEALALVPAPAGRPQAGLVLTGAARGLTDAERAVVAERFGGDAELFCAFRGHAMEQFAQDGRALAQALAHGDWPALRRQAHSLKGALATLGDDVGAALARQLEESAARENVSCCRAAWPPLQAHLVGLAGSERTRE